jgi:hypothetical protein
MELLQDAKPAQVSTKSYGANKGEVDYMTEQFGMEFLLRNMKSCWMSNLIVVRVAALLIQSVKLDL